MSHRRLDEMSAVRRLIAAADAQIVEAKRAKVVDLRALADLKRHRETLVAELQREEAAAR